MKTILNVEGMMCSHCENRVTTVLSAIEGVTSVAVDLEAKTVTVEHSESVLILLRTKSKIRDMT